jgi:CRP-like cAMP-binding protein
MGYRNRLLKAFDAATLERFAPRLERVSLQQREVLFDYDAPIAHVYFPETCIGSIVAVMADGSAVETATIGDEGLVGIALFFGTDRIAAQAFCQVTGEALRMTAVDFQELLGVAAVRAVLGRYTQALLTQVSQSSACNRRHAMTQRCARWLLQTHDRVHRDEFPLTQDFLAQMLGVRRATVTEAAAGLQKAGVITYKYGRITVVDRAGLEARSCECYGIIAREYARLVDGHEAPDPLDGLRTSERGLSTLTAPSHDSTES